MLTHILNDLRHAARRLSASPGFTAAAVATIAIGVGINTGVFSVLNGFAFRALPVPQAEQIVGLGQSIDGIERRVSGAAIMFSTDEYRTYRDGARTLSGLVGFSTTNYVTLGGESPQQIGGALVTCNYFDVLRQPVALGPGFRAGDCEQDGAAPAIVLGHDLWTSAFGADPEIVGREVMIERRSFRVVGVAAEGARGVDLVAAQFFAPIGAQPLLSPDFDLLHDAQASWLTLLGRIAPGATLEQVRAELGVIAARIDQQQPPRKTTLLTEAQRPVQRPGARAFVIGVGAVVMAAFAMVLLIACANVANLLLARAAGRSAEIAVRLSLGASRGRIVQQLLAESLLIAVLGGALGSLLALWSFQGVVVFAMTALPPPVPQLTIDTGPDAGVLAFACALTLASGVLFGLAPALRASRRDLHTAMKGASASGEGSESRLRGTLVAAQVAICIVLVIAASLLLRGVIATQTAEPGFRYRDVVVAEVFGFGGYDAEREAVLRRELAERVGALPGVEAVAHGALMPLAEGTMTIGAGLPGQQPLVPFGFNSVSAGYFSLLEIPLIRGRGFTAADEGDASTAAIVSEATARRFWPGADPVGQKLVLGAWIDQPSREVEIVGVARDAQIAAIGEVPSAYVYLPSARTQRGLQLLAKANDYAGTAAAIRAAVTALDPGLVVRITPLEANLDIWRRLAGVVSTLAASLGAVALLLALVGVYGVVAYAVGKRAREIAVRVALGASSGDVVALVLRKTMRPVFAGAAIGLLAGLGVSRLLSGVLFGVSPADPAALAAALLVVLGGAAVAAIVPARRAVAADPNSVLHHE